MGTVHHHTNIIKVGNSRGIRIPKDYLEAFDKEVILEKTEEGLLIRPANHVAPLKDWDKLFAAVDITPDDELKDWEITLSDGIE